MKYKAGDKFIIEIETHYNHSGEKNSARPLNDNDGANVTLKKEYVLMDEYDREVDVEDFIELVQQKQNDRNCKSNPDNFEYAKNIDGYRFEDREFS